MSDTGTGSKKVKRLTLPPGWIEQFSKKYPDKPFYFNEKTGESRWSPPLKLPENVMDSERKGKKRKNSEKESEEVFNANSSISSNLSNATISSRPKLKPKSIKKNDEKQLDNDTPAMRMYREKVAQRKAAQELKKNISKSSKQKQNKITTPPPTIVPRPTSSPSTSMQTRRRRTCNSISLNDTASTSISNISEISSMISKIKSSPSSTLVKTPTRPHTRPPTKNPTRAPTRTPTRVTRSLVQTPGNLPDIVKVPKAEASSDCDTVINRNINSTSFNDIKIIKKASQKNMASERLENIRRSLSNDRDNGSPAKHLQGVSNSNNTVNDSSVDKSKLFNQPIPIIFTKAHMRLYSLENRVKNNGLLELNRKKQRLNEEDNAKSKRILSKFEDSDIHCEEMEWEPIEDEKIMSEVYSVRFQLCENPVKNLNEFSCNSMMSVDSVGEKHALYIIVDTNVFLSNLLFIEEIRDSYSDIFGRPFIVIPWTVLQELDFIKDNRNHTRSQALKLKARRAVEFLNKHFSAKHPRFLGQKPNDVERNKRKFVTECPDDEILQTCLQLKESLKSPVLLSYDKNLCNKAMIHDIPILGRNDPLEKIYYLKAAETTSFLSNNLDLSRDERSQDVSIIQKELLAADDILENGKAVLKDVLSKVVAKEMENLFGERWEMYVIIRPPWSVVTVLKCTLKHWMAAVSDSFTRRTESMLRDILIYINDIPQGGRKLKDVKFFLDKCNDVVQTLNEHKYPCLKSETLTKIEELRQTCLRTIQELNNEKFQENVGSAEDSGEEERRGTLAFKVFEEIYAFARDICGLSADAMGLTCSFAFNKLHPFLTTKVALQQQRDVGVNVNKLLQVLRTTLSKLNDGTGLDDKIVLSMYEVLINFSSDLCFDELSQVTPLDIYCCIKLKKPILEKGLEQLQELAIHFCRMANYQCM